MSIFSQPSNSYLALCLLGLAAIAPSASHAEQGNLSQQIERVRQIVLNRGDDPAALAHLIQLTKDFPPSEAANLFSNLAEVYCAQGDFHLAAEVLHQLIDQYPELPQATSGLIKLVHIYSSSEIALALQTSTSSAQRRAFPVYALRVAEESLKKRPDLAENAALAFQSAVAARLAGNENTAKSWLTPLKHNPRNQPWQKLALAEGWLEGDRSRPAPRPTVRCRKTLERPLLDGALDEPLWEGIQPLELSKSGQATHLRLAYDDRFLFVAIHCLKRQEVTYPTDQSPRNYDDDIAGQDHIRLLLDPDRDYATWFQLAIDHRGKTTDTCCQSKSWNPRWFVAHSNDNAQWTAEAAIPWDQLSAQPPVPHQAWALAIERVLPSHMPNRWTGASEGDISPSNFGLMLFD